jgi:hypothetical protein
VTSDLAPPRSKADHGQGVSGTATSPEKARKLFVIKILTSNPLRLNILQGIFANPAPIKAFRGVEGGGYPSHSEFSQNETAPEPPIELLSPTIFLIHFHHSLSPEVPRTFVLNL